LFGFSAFYYVKQRFLSLSLLLFSTFSLGDDICLDMHVIQSVPQGFYDEQQNVVGMDFEVLQQIEKYSGICMTKRLMPIARIWKSIEQGQHDGGLIFKSSGRDHLVEYAAFIRHAEIIVIPRKGLILDNYEQLHKISIAKTRGSPLSNRFDSDNKLNLSEVTNYGQLIQMLEFGRIDAVAGSAAPLFYHLAKLDNVETNIEVNKKFVLGSREKWLQFSKKSADLDQIPKLKEAVGLMIKNGDYERIMRKYYGSNAEYFSSAD
jgi:ABC-type amino acid transport substrate-binding protein